MLFTVTAMLKDAMGYATESEFCYHAHQMARRTALKCTPRRPLEVFHARRPLVSRGVGWRQSCYPTAAPSKGPSELATRLRGKRRMRTEGERPYVLVVRPAGGERESVQPPSNANTDALPPR